MRYEPLREIKDIIDPKHTALILVDLQYDFCSEEGSFATSGLDITAVTKILPQIKKVLAAARNSGAFVVHVQQTTLPSEMSDGDAWYAFKTRDGKKPDYALINTKGHEILPEFAPLENEVRILKFRPSSFHGTALDQILRANGIRTVVVVGERTEGCVLATVLDASFHDYYTCVLEDCVATTSEKMGEAAMTIIKSRYKVFPSDQAISIWNQK